jgi:hypothetical protein
MNEFLVRSGRLRDKAEERRIGRKLRSLSKKERLPRPIFEGALAIIPGASMEVVPMHNDGMGNISVFLTKRDNNDKFWPGQYHCPGTMVLNRDFTSDELDSAWKRLKTNEFHEQGIGSPVFVSKNLLKTKRGNEVALVHYVEVPLDLAGGEYFLIENLPENLVEHHRNIINIAADYYKKTHE